MVDTRMLPVVPSPEQTPKPTAGGTSPMLNRRAALQGLAAGVGASLALPFALEGHEHPVERHAAARATAARPEDDAKLEFLDAHQFATLAVVAELIVPGAKATASDRFIDSVLAVESTETQQRFLSALGAFDGAAIERHRKPFKELTEAEQVGLLEEMSTQEPTKADQTANGEQSGEQRSDRRPANLAGPARPNVRAHFDHLKEWVARSHYSSEAGMKELGWTGNLFHESYPGCTHPGGHK
ncbi:MAG: hypothetical protein GEU99_20020 [Luteitalea sp.]|nr:hypothetical protein [Luteitalea sp.]